MICGRCKHFGELGHCRQVEDGKRQDVGYFQPACKKYIGAGESATQVHDRTMTCKCCGRSFEPEKMAMRAGRHIRLCRECNAAIRAHAGRSHGKKATIKR